MRGTSNGRTGAGDRKRRTAIVLALALMGLAAMVFAAPASAEFGTCAISGVSPYQTLTLSGPGATNTLEVAGDIIKDDGGVLPAPCDGTAADVDDIATIVVNGTAGGEQLEILMAGGSFTATFNLVLGGGDDTLVITGT